MSRVASLDPHVRHVIAIAAKLATLDILEGRYPSNISLDDSEDADNKTHREALAELATEQQRAQTLLRSTVDGSTAWLGKVVDHFGVDLHALPDLPESGPLAAGVPKETWVDIAVELVLVSVGLGGRKEHGKGKGKEEVGETPLEYSALERALVVRAARALGIGLGVVEGAEKSIAQVLYFEISGKDGGNGNDKEPVGKSGGNAWEEAATAKRKEASKRGNALRWAATAGGFVLGGVAIGLTGGLAAPALAPFLVGGLGMAAFGGAGGAILIGTLLGLGGGGLAGYRTHRRLKGLDELTFEKLEIPDIPAIPSLVAKIVCSGFLLDLEDSVEPWRPTFRKGGVDTFALKADTETFLSAGQALNKYIQNKIIMTGSVELLKTTALAALYAGVALPLTVFNGASMVLDSDFSRCRDKAKKAGILLAEILEKKIQGSRPCILVGYGPGATIIFEALLELHRREQGSLVFSAVLISLPSSPNAVKWASARSVVAHRLVNCFSSNDWLLAINARLYSLAARVAGMQAVQAEGIENIDCSDLLDFPPEDVPLWLPLSAHLLLLPLAITAMTTYLITGASRGIGLELTRQILANSPSNSVIATARNPSTAVGLQSLLKENPGRLNLITLDISDPESVKSGIAAAAKLDSASRGLDVLINNAGITTGGMKPATQGTREELEADLRTNLFGPIEVTLEALPLLRAGTLKKILTLGSIAGSIGGPVSGMPIAATYSTSKAALHMWTKKLSVELQDVGFTVMISHPGSVVTDGSGGKDGFGKISPEESVNGVLKYFDASTPEADNGRFYNWTGETLAW